MVWITSIVTRTHIHVQESVSPLAHLQDHATKVDKAGHGFGKRLRKHIRPSLAGRLILIPRCWWLLVPILNEGLLCVVMAFVNQERLSFPRSSLTSETKFLLAIQYCSHDLVRCIRGNELGGRVVKYVPLSPSPNSNTKSSSTEWELDWKSEQTQLHRELGCWSM